MKNETPSEAGAVTQLNEVDREIRDTKNLVYLWTVLVVTFYVGWFCLSEFKYLSKGPGEDGGVLGDYFGGLLNPVVALAAFYWLTKGVRIQKLELADTKKALEEQAEYSRTSVRIDALSALIEAHTADISYRREHLAFLMNQKTQGLTHAYYSMRGKTLNNTEFEQMVKNLNAGISVRVKERVSYAAELKMLLEASRTPDEKITVSTWIKGASVDSDDEV